MLNALAQGLEVNTKILSLPHFVPRLKTKSMAVTSSAGSMTAKELMCELNARGLDTDGFKNVLLPRMQGCPGQIQRARGIYQEVSGTE